MQPARLMPLWSCPWPPCRLVPAAITIRYRAGYGQPVTLSIEQGSSILSAPGYHFNPGDAPLVVGELGLSVTVPGAGIDGG